MRNKRTIALRTALGLLPLVAGCTKPAPWAGLTAAQIAEAVRQKNIGIAHLEDDQRGQATQAFQTLIQVAPNVGLGYADRAVSMLQDPDKSAPAMEDARKAVDLAPNDSAIRMVLAQLLSQQRDYDGAIQQLKAAVQANPNDARALFQLSEVYTLQAGGNRLIPERGQALKQLAERRPDNLVAQLLWANFASGTGHAPEARAALDRAVALAGPLPSGGDGFVAAAHSALQSGDATRAAGSIQTLTNILAPTARQQADRALLEGAHGDPASLAVREFSPPPPAPPSAPPAPVAVRFEDVTTAMGLPAATGSGLMDREGGWRTVTAASLVGKKPPYLYVAGMDREGVLYENQGGRLVDVTRAAGLAGSGGTFARFVDIDNDGKLDLYVAGDRPDRIYRGLGNGRFAPMSVRGLPASGGEVAGALWADFDNDGDLDLLRLEYGPGGGRVRLFRNNADGSFTEITKPAGITAPVKQPSMALFSDFDDEGDLDFLVASHSSGLSLYDNLHGGRFAEVAAARGLGTAAGSIAAAAADINHDGLPDLVVIGTGTPKITLYRNQGAGHFAADPSLPPLLANFAPSDVAFLDYDNDGQPDLVFAGRQESTGGHAGVAGLRLLHGEPGGRFTDASSILPPVAAHAVLPVDLDGDGAIDLVALRDDGGITLLHNNGGAKNHWLNVALEGEIKGSKKNNAFGLGATIEVKRARQYQKQTVRESVTHFGLGPDAASPEVVRIVWSNGVPQNLDAARAPGVNTLVHEKQVLKGSCPFLYAWDGERYRFVTDILWRSPLGLRLTPTRVAPHDQSTDFVKIPRELLRPVNGHYFLSVTEELWETLYLDYARLIAVDHPTAADVWVDEVFRPGPPAPFRLYPVAEKRLPVAAVDDAGRDQLPALRARDGRHVAGFALTGYQGVAVPHDLTLALGPVPDPAHVRLFLQGWIFPTDTSVNMAVSQNRSVQVIPPRLAVPDGRGGWKPVAEIGLPAGKNKTVVVNLSGKLNVADPRLRITTTMEIYWDHIFFTSGPQKVPLRSHTLAPVWTDLHYRGFSRLVQAERSQPHWFDYDRVDRAPHWRDQEGFFTRYGGVTPLLRAIDDQYVIMNAGDELLIQFDGRALPTAPAGWVRDFFLVTDGWDKDADLNTLASQRVEPLPFHGMAHYPPTGSEHYPDTPASRRYRREYNTRSVTPRRFLDALKVPRG